MQNRKKIEKLVYDVFDAIDKTGSNTTYYKELFKSMNDKQFHEFLSGRLPFRVFHEIFKIEPQPDEILDAFKILGAPLIEEINTPYLYRLPDGTPIKTHEGMVIYVHLKRMVQMINKKNNITFSIGNRDQKTGHLMYEDKGAKVTDREFEILSFLNLENTIQELSGPRADAMEAKAQMYNAIAEKGYVEQKDITYKSEDSLSRNLVNSYLLGAHIYSNLLNKDYMTPATVARKKVNIKKGV